MRKKLWRRVLIFSGALLLVLGAAFLLKGRDAFPYGKPREGIRITFSGSGFGGSLEYQIVAGEVHGKAILTPVSDLVSAQRMIRSEFVGIYTSFEPARAPYGGHITSFIDCDAKKYLRDRQVPFRGRQTKLVLAVANQRYGVGSCDLQLIRHASLFWSAYDESRGQVVTVKLFHPVGGLNEVEESQIKAFQVFQNIIEEDDR